MIYRECAPAIFGKYRDEKMYRLFIYAYLFFTLRLKRIFAHTPDGLINTAPSPRNLTIAALLTWFELTWSDNVELPPYYIGPGMCILKPAQGWQTGSQGMHMAGSQGMHATCAQGSHCWKAERWCVNQTFCGCVRAWVGKREPVRQKAQLVPLPLVVQPIFTEETRRATAQSNINFFMV